MPFVPRALAGPLAAVGVLSLGVAGCGGAADGAEGKPGTVAVQSGDDSCAVAASTLPAGAHTFAVRNSGGDVTEVYVYGTGDRVVGEVENVGPGTTRELTVELAAGTYTVSCRPGMTGSGIRKPLTVTASAASAAPVDPRLAAGVARYRRYVIAQAALLVTRTRAFAAAVKAGDVGTAQRLYAPSREPWERIEPVAESFGDLDPRLDARVNDVAAGTRWTGWHRIEQALWVSRSTRGMGPYADQLVHDVLNLQRRVPQAPLTASSLGNGASELLSEVATGKVTGEEERYSHTDLVDFAANVDGAEVAYQALRPVVVDRSPALARQLDARFAAVRTGLAAHRSGSSYRPYTDLTRTQVRGLAAQVDALAEPLSRLTAAVLGR